MTLMKNAALCAALSVSLTAAAFAAEPSQTLAITHAKILSMGPAGQIADGTLVIRDGKILAVGAGLTPPAGATIIDAKGAIVTPGLIASNTVLGVVEVNSVKKTDDARTGNAELSASFDLQYGLNPDSSLLPVARLGGVTRAIVVPDYGDAGEGGGPKSLLFAGQAAMVTLAQGSSILYRPKIGMVLELGEDGADRAGGSRAAEYGALLTLLDDVRFYRGHRAAYERGETRSLSVSRGDLEALIPVVEGRMPVIATVHRASDIRQLLVLAKQQGIKLILSGAEEGWRVAPEIAAAGVPVVLNATADLPTNFELLGATLENAARLQAAGVQIAIVGSDPAHRVREMRYNAGTAVAHGLPYAAALEAITIAPARIFGVADAVGSLQAGKIADVVIWDGDPLEPRSQPTAIFIAGQAQPLRSRALDLRDRYEAADVAGR